MANGSLPSHRSMVIKVSIFAVVMLLVATGLVVVFGNFRFGPESTYHATFTDASRLEGRPEGPNRRSAGRRGVGYQAQPGQHRSTWLSESTRATPCTRPRVR